jgi:hypothetical protein
MGTTSRPVRFRPDRATLFAALIWFFGAAPLAASKPWLAWLVLPPIGLGVWALRASVVAGPDGLSVCNGLGTRRYAWSDVEGFDVGNRRALPPVVLLTTHGHRVRLSALRRSQLPRVLEASRKG